MARPRSEDKRAAIMSAATRVVASAGLGAATATIAREAGVSNGSLFTYFDTKSALLNELYLELKGEMASVATSGLAADGEVRERLHHLWSQWLGWAAAYPEKRRALAQLEVSDEVTPETHRAAGAPLAGIAQIIERARAGGPMAGVPLPYLVALANSLAETAIDFIMSDPANADAHGQVGFDALWRMIA